MGIKIVHISDTHGKHEGITIPPCNLLLCTGDIGTRTDLRELTEFLIWFERQPADMRILCAGNHDICLDKKWVDRQKGVGTIEGLLAFQHYMDAKELITKYDITYLEETDYVYEGLKIYGSPYSPSFHRDNWVFNADRGQEIRTHWGRIPADVDILLTHSPVFGVLDTVPIEGRTAWHIDGHVGCQDLMEVVKKRLTRLKLHCFGHIHDNSGVIFKKISNTRSAMFSNGACVDNWYKSVITKPLIIEL